jgi:hypothetical protein
MYDRSKCVGASDAVHIAAGNWAELYDQKTSSEPFKPSLPARIGQACEALNREWFTQETGIHVRWHDEWHDTPIKHPDHEWYTYLPDGIVDEHQLHIPWEGKAINGMWQPHLLIKKYTPQLLHQMRVVSAPYAYLSVIYLNTKWDHYRIDYDDAAADALFEKEELFNFHLQRGIRPPEFKGKRKGWV